MSTSSVYKRPVQEVTTLVALDYGVLMSDNEDFEPDVDGAIDRDDLRWRPPLLLGDKLRTVAEIELKTRKLQGKRGDLSVNQMMSQIIKRYVFAFEARYGELPAMVVGKDKKGKEVRRPDDAKTAQYAHGLAARRAAEHKKK